MSAPVDKLTTISTLFVVAVVSNWDLHHLDVHNAFIHGDLHEEVCLQPPPGYLLAEDNRVGRLC